MALIPVTMFFAYLIFRKSIGYGFSRVTLYLPGAVGGIMLAALAVVMFFVNEPKLVAEQNQ